MSGPGEGCSFQGEVARRKSTGGAFAMDPALAVLDDFPASDVVADKIDELAFHSRNDLLECFQNEGIDQEVIYSGEIRAERHVIQVKIGFL